MSDGNDGGLMSLPPIYSEGEEPGVALMREIARKLAEHGLPRHGEDTKRIITGLVNPEAFGDTGFSVKELNNRELEFHIVISGGVAGIEYNEWTEWQSGYGAMTAREPLNQKSLHSAIRDAFRDMGFTVKKVKNDSHAKYGSDDVTYVVITEYPEILKVSASGGDRKDDNVSKQWDAFFDSLKPAKKY